MCSAASPWDCSDIAACHCGSSPVPFGSARLLMEGPGDSQKKIQLKPLRIPELLEGLVSLNRTSGEPTDTGDPTQPDRKICLSALFIYRIYLPCSFKNRFFLTPPGRAGLAGMLTYLPDTTRASFGPTVRQPPILTPTALLGPERPEKIRTGRRG